MTYILFVIGFALLIKGADLLVEGAASVAKKFKISNIVIGLTIVSFGTSAPELVVNLFASISGNNEIAVGNILGSNIANILLILGISAIIYPLRVQKNTVWKEIPLSLLAGLVILVMGNDIFLDGYSHNEISRTDGLTLLGFFSIFMVYVFAIARENPEEVSGDVKELTTFKSVLFILLGLTGLILGGKWIVDGAVEISLGLGMSQSLVGLTIVAVGTSLPELATSAVAAYKKQSDIAIGNVVGSNIFNIFWILGLSATIKPMPLTPANNIDIMMVVLASLLLFLSIFIFGRHQIGRKEGILFVLIYVLYTVYLIINV
ncbi:MAG TPA: sodium:proton exchanger [Bacteroidetes bacterium]|nr:calcium/sodium antiporter [Ignavibacteria bacterium]HCA42366.1 sodium:proton exchanger [Bacteroidota bacterium]HCN38497.1 sodium:proton exchanger [Bacteroidota bacterium]